MSKDGGVSDLLTVESFYAYTVSHTKPDSNGGHPATRLSDDERERAIKAVFHAVEMEGAYINRRPAARVLSVAEI